ncbi:MAG TPA: aspartate aminotransferase family protein [Mycobacteriales bacterium]|jgi:glutamate-1-semialdehyde 2,1-aminomutase|nr:aspartate aminotransferase family protein [Mycobacteriales bacterium]
MKPHPLYFERGAGSRLWDVDGNEYLDFVLGWGPLILGHSHPALTEAVGTQLPLGQTFGSGHAAEYEVAEQICAAYPGAERVLWSNTGTEAVQVAPRLARAATGRTAVVKFEGHYHGWSDQLLLGYRPDTDGALTGLGSRGQHPRSPDDILLLRWGDLDRLREALSGDTDIAAVFTEPALCNSGVIAPPDGLLAELRELCDRAGTMLIFDEVITGFRVAYGGGAARYGVRPDLAVFAKALAGGFPLAAVAGRGELIDQVTAGVVHAGTYNGNPIVLAAAGATLRELARPGVYENFEALGGRLAAGIADAFFRHGRDGVVNQIGPVVQGAPGLTRLDDFAAFLSVDWPDYDRIVVELLRRGIFCLPGGRWYLSTAHTTADIDRAVDAFDEALTATIG